MMMMMMIMMTMMMFGNNESAQLHKMGIQKPCPQYWQTATWPRFAKRSCNGLSFKQQQLMNMIFLLPPLHPRRERSRRFALNEGRQATRTHMG